MLLNHLAFYTLDLLFLLLLLLQKLLYDNYYHLAYRLLQIYFLLHFLLMFHHLKHKLDLNYDFGLSLTEQEIHRISNVLAYSWLAISTFFLVTLAVYVIEPARPHYLRVSGVLSLISGIISCIYCMFVSYDCVDV